MWPITIEEGEELVCKCISGSKNRSINLQKCFYFAKFVKTKAKIDDFDPFYAGMVVAQAFLS